MTAIKTTVDNITETVDHPMSGYNGDYDYLKIEIDFNELVNGKFRADVTETVYHGPECDEGEEYDDDIDSEGPYKHSSPEFDTLDEAIAWSEDEENVNFDYQG